MTLAHGTDRLESSRLVLRRVSPDDLPFFTRIHALPEVAENLYPEGRPRTPEETARWLQDTLARGASPNGRARASRARWTSSASRGSVGCGHFDNRSPSSG